MEVLRAALKSFDEAAVFTIHGFCHRMLHDVAFDGGFPFDSELVPEASTFRDELVRDFLARELATGAPSLVAFASGRGSLREDLNRLADLVIRYWEIRLQPEPQDLPSAETAFLSAHQDVSDAWKTSRHEILERLTRAKAEKQLNAGSYSQTRLQRFAALLDAYTRLPGDLAFNAFPDEAADFFSSSKIASATRKSQPTPTHPFFADVDRLQAALQRQREHLADQFIALKHRLAHFIRDQVPQRRKRRNILFYDDLLRDMDGALQRDDKLITAIRQRYRAAMIDEFQDTSSVQYRIFKSIFHQPTDLLFLIGDPKQAIYGFRNADIFTYLSAVRDRTTRTLTLDLNWRSDANLVEAVNYLFSRDDLPFRFPEIPFSPVRAKYGGERFAPGNLHPAPVEFAFVSQAPQSANGGGTPRPMAKKIALSRLAPLVADRVGLLLTSSAKIQGEFLKPGDIAVLVRTNEQARQIQAALRDQAIPSVIYSQDDVLASRETTELMRILVAVADPTHAGRLRAAITTDAMGADAHDLVHMDQDERRWAAIVDRFRAYQILWEERGFISMIRHLESRESVISRLAGYGDGARRVTNWRHLIEVLHTQARRERLGPRELIAWFQQRRSRAEPLAEMRLESDADAVQVVTLHRCKGLEYPIVLCPTLWEDSPFAKADLVFHDPEQGDALTLDVGIAAHPDAQAQTRFEVDAERMRLLYVALTRAKHRLIIFWGRFSQVENAPLHALIRSQTPGQATKPPDECTLWNDVTALQAQKPHLFYATRSDESQAVTFLPTHTRPAPPPALEICPYRRKLTAWHRITSYSSLVSHHDETDRDHDAWAIPPQSAVTPLPADAEPTSPILLDAFPKGAQAGECFHKIFEKIDFSSIPSEESQAVIATELATFGFDAPSWTTTIAHAVSEIIITPLSTGHGILRLSDVPVDQRLNELAFLFPVRASNDPASETPLTVARLSDVIARHAQTPWLRDYARHLSTWHALPLMGYFKGFIDLVFCHQNRWYLVDYKSNHLGSHSADYAPAHLQQAMMQHHYILQYHIYAVALHRFLRHHLADYRFNDHFGGVLYLFLRGISPDNDGRTGVFVDHPRAGLIEALSDACATAGGSP